MAKGAVPTKPGQSTPKGYAVGFDVDLQNETTSKPYVIPWQATGEHEPNTAAVPQEMVDQMHEGLPPVIRRTPTERYESLVRRLTETARETKQMYGRVVWPTSVQRVLTEIGVKPSADERTQVYALAKHYILKAENQQRRKDSKKTVLDWHGHYS